MLSRVAFILLTGLVLTGFFMILLLNPGSTVELDQEIGICDRPVTFRIGEVDSRFDMDMAELKKVAAEAGAIWSEAAGRTLVEYDEGGNVQINLVYDERQEQIDEERSAAREIDRLDQIYREKNHRFERVLDEYNAQMDSYSRLTEDFQEMIDSHNRWLQQGASTVRRDRSEIRSRESEISRFREEVTERGNRVYRLEEEVRRFVEELNSLNDEKNELIADYNTRFAGLHVFNQGEYVATRTSAEINVYKFVDHRELRHVLAHEFGHALGLGHVNNPEAVMYRVVENLWEKGFVLAEEDISAIRQRCSADRQSGR